ncbi:MAG: DUF1707 domain-containing protein, partial [Pseudonocardia sp.]|nr:DUF1707 domain-containing protein [Pseudonocardia sp.]
MEVEPSSHKPQRVAESDREAAAAQLQQAAGDGRLTLEEFSDRVGAVWSADTRDQLQAAVGEVGTAPPVGTLRPVSSVVTVFGDARRVGRWRLPRRVRGLALLGDIHLDLRHVVVDEPVVDITAVTVFGNLYVAVPEGVEVELHGFDVLGDRELRLAAVPRRPGTPMIR